MSIIRSIVSISYYSSWVTIVVERLTRGGHAYMCLHTYLDFLVNKHSNIRKMYQKKKLNLHEDAHPDPPAK